MSRFSRTLGLALLALGVALLLCQAGASVQPSYQAVSGIPALSLNAGFSPVLLASMAPPERILLPNSALGSNDLICSVETSDFPPTPLCSAGSGSLPVKCSAHCDSANQCSAYENTPTGDGLCSTLGNNSGNFCSVLNRATTPAGPSFCSAFGAGSPDVHVVCSTSGNGPTQACSVKNLTSPQFQNYCSAVSGGSQPMDRGADCSTFFGSQASGNKFACSAFKRRASGRKFCSAVGGNNCSTVVESSTGSFKGKCTSLRMAYPGTCSTLANDPANGFCSVVTDGTGPNAQGICGGH